MFEIKDSFLKEVTQNIDKTEEKVPDSENSGLRVIEIADIDYIHIYSFQAMNLRSRDFRRAESSVRKTIREFFCINFQK